MQKISPPVAKRRPTLSLRWRFFLIFSAAIVFLVVAEVLIIRQLIANSYSVGHSMLAALCLCAFVGLRPWQVPKRIRNHGFEMLFYPFFIVSAMLLTLIITRMVA